MLTEQHTSIKIYRIPTGALQAICYIVTPDQKTCLVIDPGSEPDRILKRIRHLDLTPKLILLTHGHYDHIEAVNPLREAFNIKALVHSQDQEIISSALWSRYLDRPFTDVAVDSTFENGDQFSIDDLSIEVLHTPGHSPGSCSFIIGSHIFSGDTLFAQGGVGRTDLWRSSYMAICDSINGKLFKLPDHYSVYPGHGNSTQLGIEKKLHQKFRLLDQ